MNRNTSENFDEESWYIVEKHKTDDNPCEEDGFPVRGKDTCNQAEDRSLGEESSRIISQLSKVLNLLGVARLAFPSAVKSKADH